MREGASVKPGRTLTCCGRNDRAPSWKAQLLARLALTVKIAHAALLARAKRALNNGPTKPGHLPWYASSGD